MTVTTNDLRTGASFVNLSPKHLLTTTDYVWKLNDLG